MQQFKSNGCRKSIAPWRCEDFLLNANDYYLIIIFLKITFPEVCAGHPEPLILPSSKKS
jgi:hypothetical protein